MLAKLNRTDRKVWLFACLSVLLGCAGRPSEHEIRSSTSKVLQSSGFNSISIGKIRVTEGDADNVYVVVNFVGEATESLKGMGSEMHPAPIDPDRLICQSEMLLQRGSDNQWSAIFVDKNKPWVCSALSVKEQ